MKKPLLHRQSALDHSALAIPLAPTHPTVTAKKESSEKQQKEEQKSSNLKALDCEGFVAYKVSAIKFIP